MKLKISKAELRLFSLTLSKVRSSQAVNLFHAAVDSQLVRHRVLRWVIENISDGQFLVPAHSAVKTE